MITDILIDGFKSLKDVSIEIKPLTVLIGLNSSGKSSILQLFRILKQTVLSGSKSLLTNGNLVNLGSFDDVVFKGQKEIGIRIMGTRVQSLHSPFSRATRYLHYFVVDHDGLNYHESSIRSGNFSLKGKYRRGSASKRIQIPFREGKLEFGLEDTIGRPFMFAGHSGNIEELYTRIITRQFLQVINDDLRDFFLVPAMRGINLPSYPLDTKASDDLTDVVNLHNQAIKFSSTVVYESPSMENKINKWISRITGITVRARTVPDKRASIEASRKYEVNLVNEGFGTNQLTHLFAQIAKAPSSSLIGIEEPEVHLHPKAQSELAKVLAEITKEEKKNLILTTHSEHILYRLLIEIAKGTLKPEDLAIYHFKLSSKGITQVERLKPDKKGRLDKGIPDFLETDLDEFKSFLETLKV